MLNLLSRRRGPSLVLGLVHQGTLLDPRHHVAQLGADFLDRVLGKLGEEHPVEKIGKELRAMMPWLREHRLVDRSKN